MYKYIYVGLLYLFHLLWFIGEKIVGIHIREGFLTLKSAKIKKNSQILFCKIL